MPVAQAWHRGLVRLLPAWPVVGDLRLPQSLRMPDGMGMAAAQAPPGHLEGAAPPLGRGRILTTLSVRGHTGAAVHDAAPTESYGNYAGPWD